MDTAPPNNLPNRPVASQAVRSIREATLRIPRQLDILTTELEKLSHDPTFASLMPSTTPPIKTIAKRLNAIAVKMDDTTGTCENIDAQWIKLDSDTLSNQMDSHINFMKVRVGLLENRVDLTHKRSDTIETHSDRVEGRVNKMDTRLENIEEKVDDNLTHLLDMENKMNKKLEEMKTSFSTLTANMSAWMINTQLGPDEKLKPLVHEITGLQVPGGFPRTANDVANMSWPEKKQLGTALNLPAMSSITSAAQRDTYYRALKTKIGIMS
ncbi:hypothetical protein B7494_g6419 [Chlorociboria aeruginascens]|nr:hypothetical protein B7494_g6419 [Chlorociboria aeruginascens]